MRTVKYTNRFKRDYRREKSGQHGNKLDAILMDVINLLAADNSLPHRNFDHALTGEWHDHRDCHIRPDLIRIYRKPDFNNLELVRLGSTASSAGNPLAVAGQTPKQAKTVIASRPCGVAIQKPHHRTYATARPRRPPRHR